MPLSVRQLSVVLSSLMFYLDGTKRQFYTVPMAKGKTRMFIAIAAGLTALKKQISDIIVLFPNEVLKA